jgi:hypothetical protein
MTEPKHPESKSRGRDNFQSSLLPSPLFAQQDSEPSSLNSEEFDSEQFEEQRSRLILKELGYPHCRPLLSDDRESWQEGTSSCRSVSSRSQRRLYSFVRKDKGRPDLVKL